MLVLLLSPYATRLMPALNGTGDEYLCTVDGISRELCIAHGVDFIVSYGYRHLISANVLEAYPNRVINLHTSLLPKQRGAHPNFWTVVEREQSGVSIHLVDEGLDTGNLLLQQEVMIDPAIDTFASSYTKLALAIEDLFCLNWHKIRTGSCKNWKQYGEASYHSSKELESWLPCLPDGWNTSIARFEELRSVHHPANRSTG